MPTFHATFHYVENRNMTGKVMAVVRGRGAIGTTALTTSGTAQTAQRGGSDWQAPSDGYVTLHCDGAVRVGFGETAQTGASPVGLLVPAGMTINGSIAAGETLSVIDA